VIWYASTAPTVSAGVTATLTTPSITAPGTLTYYVAAKTTATGCVSTDRTTVVATANALPAAPVTSGTNRCGTGTVTVKAASVSGQSTNWYSVSTAGTALASGIDSLVVASIAATTTYYAEAKITATGCVSAARATAIALVSAAVPTAATAGIVEAVVSDVCGAKVRRYTATAVANATSYVWTLPAGGVLDSGSTGNIIKVRYATTSATVATDSIRVRAANACGNATLTKAVKVTLVACTPFTAKSVVTTPQSAVIPAERMQVSVFPNPTMSNFNVQVKGTANEAGVITARVMDLQGRVLKLVNVTPNQTLNLGSELKAGTYLIEVRQGKNTTTTKVLKF
jgi:hypothetical protein